MTTTTTTTDTSFYKYAPSHALAVIGAVVFAILLVAHLVQGIRFRTWYMWVMIISPAFEVIGFASRYVSIDNQKAKTPLIISSIGLILPPVFNCAVLYMIFGRLIAGVGNQYSFLKGSIVSVVFVISDAITFLVQVFGASALIDASSVSKYNMGRNILLGGLILQIVSFGIFALAVCHFDARTRSAAVAGREKWSPLLNAMHVNSVLILARSVFRILEFAQVASTLETTEAYFYVFDSLLIVIATALLVYYHPGKHVPRTAAVAPPTPEGKLESAMGPTGVQQVVLATTKK
ncbi:hypothetical protein HKX48_001810 [Thoreauomyces humboldtii]|nr:hypothetical protein HKX48_001810 [Thoreauomyces humboldtii]